MHQLNTMESLFVFMDQRGPGMSMAMIQIFSANRNDDPHRRYGMIANRIRDAIPLIPMLHQKIYRVPGDADKPYWVTEDKVDLEYHIRHLALPSPGNREQLTELYGQLLSLPMDMEMPLWRVYVVEDLNSMEGLPTQSYAVITKMHHASADGITAAKVTGVIAGAPVEQAAKKADDLYIAPGVYEVIANTIRNSLNSSLKIGYGTLSNLSSMSKWAARSLVDAALKRENPDKVIVPPTRFNGAVSPDRIFDSVTLKKADLKILGGKLGGATINDLGLTICGGALRQYLLQNKELPEHSLVAMMPISIRTNEVSGNQFAPVRIGLGTHIENPVARLQQIRSQTTKQKQAVKSLGSEKINELTNLVPGSLLGLILRNVVLYGVMAKVPPLLNCIVTSVPGPPARISLGSNELVYMSGSPPLFDGLGLIFGILGYDKDIIIAFTSCKKMIPDKKVMLSCLMESYDALVSEAGKQPAPVS